MYLRRCGILVKKTTTSQVILPLTFCRSFSYNKFHDHNIACPKANNKSCTCICVGKKNVFFCIYLFIYSLNSETKVKFIMFHKLILHVFKTTRTSSVSKNKKLKFLQLFQYKIPAVMKDNSCEWEVTL